MKDYDDVQQEYPEQNKNDKFMGYMLVFFMFVTVIFMIYSIFASWQTPGTQAYIPPPANTSTPSDEVSPSADEIPETWNSPLPESPEPVKKTASPQKTDKPENKKPEKEITAVKITPKEETFRGAPPDGPPNLDRVHGNMFEGKTGKSVIFVKSTQKAWDGARYFLIDNAAKTYRSIKFDKLENEENSYKIEVPPGDYTFKFVKTGYFTFEEPVLLQDKVEIEIVEPLEKRPTLTIESNPSGAKVYIEKKLAGTTPAVIRYFDAKKYDIEVIKDGYKTEKFSMTFRRNRDEVKTVKLSPSK
jgi:hypothetical protein